MKFRLIAITAAAATAAALAFSLSAGIGSVPQASAASIPTISEKQQFASLFAIHFAAGTPTPGIVVHTPPEMLALDADSSGTAEGLTKAVLQVNGECSAFNFSYTQPGKFSVGERASILKTVSGSYEVFLGRYAENCWDPHTGLRSMPLPLNATDQKRAIDAAARQESKALSDRIDEYVRDLSGGPDSPEVIRLDDAQISGPANLNCHRFTVKIISWKRSNGAITITGSFDSTRYVTTHIGTNGNTTYAFFAPADADPGFCG
jgi:hypothetical protein